MSYFALHGVDADMANEATLILYGQRDDRGSNQLSAPPDPNKAGDPNAKPGNDDRQRILKQKAQDIAKNCGGTASKDSPKALQKIEFQFPPKVTSDTKDGKFFTTDAYCMPPMVNFKNAGPRKISLKWEYIVTDEQGGWDVTRISKNVRTLRGYFNNGLFINDAGTNIKPAMNPENFIIYFSYGKFGEKGNALYPGGFGSCYTFYTESVDVKHSDTMVYPQKQASLIYPLKTEISLTLVEWVSGYIKANENASQNILQLVKVPTKGWF